MVCGGLTWLGCGCDRGGSISCVVIVFFVSVCPSAVVHRLLVLSLLVVGFSDGVVVGCVWRLHV